MRKRRRGVGAAAAGLVVLVLVAGVRLAAADYSGARVAAWFRGGTFLEPGPGVRQQTPTDCGPAALAHAIGLLGTPVGYPDSLAGLRSDPAGCTLGDLSRAAGRLGHPGAVRIRDPAAPQDVRSPAVLFLRPVARLGSGAPGHFVVLESAAAGAAAGRAWIVFDPAIGRIRMSSRSLRRHWTGHVLEFTAAEAIPDSPAPVPVDNASGWSFLPEVLRFPGGGPPRRPSEEAMTWTPDEPFSTCESLGETEGGTRNLPGFLCSLLRPGPVLILGSSEIALEASRSHEVIVVDWNRRRLARLQECFREQGREVRALCRDPERQDLGVGRRTVSNVICVDVLERFRDDVTVLEQLHRTLAPRGRLIVRVRTQPRTAAEPGADLLSEPRVYDPELLRESLQEAGFRPLSLRYWNFLGVSGRGRVHRGAGGAESPDPGNGRPGHPWRDRALDFWFRAVENRVGFPTGTSLVSVAEPHLEKASVRQPAVERGLARRPVREAYEPMALLR